MTECERLISDGTLEASFLKEETRCDYHIDTKMKKLWALQIDLVKQIEMICKKNQLKAFAKDRYVAAVCAAPSILADLELMKQATVHPDFKDHMGNVEVLDKSVVVDRNIITGQGLGATIPFALKLIDLMVGKEKARTIQKNICYKF